MFIVNAFTAVTAFVAGVLWLLSAQIKPEYPVAYLDGPPDRVKNNMDRQSRLNSYAAAFASASAFLQCFAFSLAAWGIAPTPSPLLQP